MESVRISLEDGNWWDIAAELTHGDRRKIDAALQEWAVATMASFEERGIDVMKFQGQQSGSGEWSPGEEDAYLLYCTVGWSYPEPVDADAIQMRSERVVRAVLAEMRKRYAGAAETDEGKGNSGGQFSSLSITPPQ